MLWVLGEPGAGLHSIATGSERAWAGLVPSAWQNALDDSGVAFGLTGLKLSAGLLEAVSVFSAINPHPSPFTIQVIESNPVYRIPCLRLDEVLQAKTQKTG